MSTFFAKKEEQKPRWYIIDANNQVLGKVAVRAANVLRGKVKPTFTPHVDAGDFELHPVGGVQKMIVLVEWIELKIEKLLDFDIRRRR